MKRTVLGFALVLLGVPALFAQMTAPMTPGQGHAMMPDCAAMMQHHEAMQKQMKEMNMTLQTLVDEMNKAKGASKVDRMAAVINELVGQRAMMQKQMMEMQPKMMEHMMSHMQSGMMKGMADSMASCPMMKAEKAPGMPAEHQR